MIDFINSLHDVIFILLAFACVPFQRYFYLKNKIISIGDTTTDHIRERGFEPLMTAKMQSYEGISSSIIDYLNKKLNHELS